MFICSKHHLSQAEALLDSHKKRKVEDHSSSNREKSNSSRKIHSTIKFCRNSHQYVSYLGHRSYGEGSSRSHTEHSSPSLSTSYRTVIDSRDRDKRADRSRVDRGRKSRTSKKDKRKERRRYIFRVCPDTVQ